MSLMLSVAVGYYIIIDAESSLGSASQLSLSRIPTNNLLDLGSNPLDAVVVFTSASVTSLFKCVNASSSLPDQSHQYVSTPHNGFSLSLHAMRRPTQYSGASWKAEEAQLT